MFGQQVYILGLKHTVCSAVDFVHGVSSSISPLISKNSIIIVGGDNTSGWSEKMSGDELEIVSNAGVVLLQRVIPDSINIQVSKENDIAFGTGM
ncbi:hypothetical protein Bca101_091155 [Brassica carinata]